MKNVCLLSRSLLALSAVSSVALAQPATTAPVTPAASATPAPATPAASTAPATSATPAASASPTTPAPEADRVHKGFYFRGALGLGYGGTKFTYERSSSDITVSGAGVGVDVWFGGSPAPGLALGGAFHFQQTVNPTISVNGIKLGETSSNLNTLLIGPFVDWFPDARGGFHLGGTLGFSRLSLTDENDNTTALSPFGFGGAFVIGYDWWVGKDWSLGITGRLLGASVSEEKYGIKTTALSYQPALMFSALYY